MTLRTLIAMLRSGQLPLLQSLMRRADHYHRLAFLGAALSSGVLRRLATGPVSLDGLAAEMGVAAGMRDGLEAWLQLGVALGELRSGPQGYSVRGRLARTLNDPAYDAAAALVEELTGLHNTLITQAPARLCQTRPLTLADQDARVVARSSRLAEPLICEALDTVIPRRGALQLLEIGCGTAAYIRYAAGRNPELTALGLELQPAAAALAAENIATWQLAGRVAIEIGDVRTRTPLPVFDVATLHQNIYYFPVAARVGVLRHIRGFLKPRGRLLLTTFCQGGRAGVAVLNLWAALTEGCGRLPAPAEMVAQLRDAGWRDVSSRSLIPGEGFYAFVATQGEG